MTTLMFEGERALPVIAYFKRWTFDHDQAISGFNKPDNSPEGHGRRAEGVLIDYQNGTNWMDWVLDPLGRLRSAGINVEIHPQLVIATGSRGAIRRLKREIQKKDQPNSA